MAVTKTTRLLKVVVEPHELPEGAPIVTTFLEDSWDDPNDDELPITKLRTIQRGRAVPEVDGIDRTPVDDLPELAQEICNTVWWYD